MGRPKNSARRPLEDRLWEKVLIPPDVLTGCWTWMGARKTRGYGNIFAGNGGRNLVLAHRAAKELVHGPGPAGSVARHSCDNPRCCNPHHIEWGTMKENHADMHARGRANRARGEALPVAKLDPVAVQLMRALSACGATIRDIAAAAGVAAWSASQAIHRRTWKHVP